jgi:TonB family protein
MSISHEKNGLTGNDIQPWHVHGTYRSYKDGNLEYEGTYEEWWISPSQYKVSFTSPKFTQTDYAIGTALLRDGAQDWPNGAELLLRESLTDPLPDPAELKGFELRRSEQRVGKGKSDCLSLAYPLRPNLQVEGTAYPTACFEASMPVLRVFEHGSSRTVYDQLVRFQGRFVAKKVFIAAADKPLAELDLDVVEALNQTRDTILAPPASAAPVDLSRIQLKEGRTQWPALLKKTAPIYPDAAKHSRIQGEVTIRATIGVDGHVENPQAIDGPGALRGASIDAVKQWVYRPVQVMGQPRPAEIEIHVFFSMG